MDNTLEIGHVKPASRLVAAPMAGISDVGYRYLAMRMGAGLTVTEMATSRGLIMGHERTRKIVATHPEARPYSIQLFGDRPDILARAAMIAEDSGADVVDLNAACPVRKIIKAGAGSSLLTDLPRLREMVAAMKSSISIPLTVKIRSGFDNDCIVAVQAAHMLREEGVAAVTLHPRTAKQGFGGKADWDLIGEVASRVDIPVIASGDIKSSADALEVSERTGCAGMMIGRAAMGNLFIFREVAAALDGRSIPGPPSNEERLDLALEHFDILLDHYDTRRAVALWRKHLCWYCKGIPNVARLRGTVFATWDVEDLRRLARDIFMGTEVKADTERRVRA